MGRFMTPDWAEKPTDVPYAHYGNPQSLNLYSYVENNPTTFGDPDGHAPWGYDGGGSGCENNDQCQKNQQLAMKEAWEANAAKLQPQNHHHHKPKPKPQPGTPAQRKVAGTIYNETSALRSTTDKGAGSAANLSDARIAIAQTREINKSKERVASSTVRDNLKDPNAKDAWEDSLDAAINAGNERNGTNGATHFYLDAGQASKPDWYNQGEIEESFGPFVVANKTNEFSAGEEVDIEIIVSPAPK